MEPNELYDQHLDPKFRGDLDELKKVAAAPNGSSASFISSTPGARSGVADIETPLLRTGRKPNGETPGPRGGYDPHVRIKDMDREGGLELLRAQIRRFRNRDDPCVPSMAGDYFAAYAARLKGVAIVPMRAPTQAAEEIRRVAREPWCVRIYLSSHMEDKLLDHPAFHPIWQACVETDLPACFHGPPARLMGWARSRWGTICSSNVPRLIHLK